MFRSLCHSDNHAIFGALQLEEARRRAAGDPASPPPHIVSSVIEHPAVIECLKALEAAGRVLLILPAPAVDGEGEEDAEARANLQRVMKSTQNVVAMLARVGNNFSVREVVAADCVVMARDALMSLQEEWTS